MAIKVRKRDAEELLQVLDYGLECLHAEAENMRSEIDSEDLFSMRCMLKAWAKLEDDIKKKLEKKGK